MTEEDEKRAFVNGLYSASREFSEVIIEERFGKNRSIAGILDTYLAIAKEADDYISSCYESAQIECKSGCSYCCYMRVAATPLELFALAYAISVSRPRSELKALSGKLFENLKKTEKLSSVDHFKAKIPCALLGDDGKCSVYAYRPMACRQWISPSKTRCETAFNFPSGDVKPQHEGTAIACGSGHLKGIHTYLTAQGLDSQAYELSFGLLRVLTTPGLFKAWLAGERVFVRYDLSDGPK